MKTPLLLLVLAGLAPAQSKPASMVNLTFVDVEPSMMEHYEAQTAAVAEAYKKTGAAFRLNYRPLFGSRLTYLSVVPVTDMTRWEQTGGELEHRMGPEAFRTWLPEYRKTTRGSARILIRTIQENTILDAKAGSLPILILTRTRVDFSRRAEYESRNKTVVIPAMKKAGVKRYILSRAVFGGANNEYFSARLHASLAEAETVNQMISHLPIAAGLIQSSERFVYRINPKTSFSKGVEIR